MYIYMCVYANYACTYVCILFIHSFSAKIYIAPPQGCYSDSEVLSTPALLKRIVCKLACIPMHTYYYIYIYIYTQCLRKNCAKLFLSELRQIFLHFNDFW